MESSDCTRARIRSRSWQRRAGTPAGHPLPVLLATSFTILASACAGRAAATGSPAGALAGAARGQVPAQCGRPAPGDGTELRVMTYNIAAGRFGLGAVAAAIRTAHPDLVGLEEVDVNFGERSSWMDEAALLADSLGMQVFFAPIYNLPPPAPGRPRRRFGLAILARCRIRAAVNHPLTRLSTQVTDPVPAPAPGFPEVDVQVGSRRVRFLATHLDYRHDPAVRRTQIAETLHLLHGLPGPLLLVGDLNATPDAAEIAPLLDSLEDAWALAASAGRARASARDSASAGAGGAPAGEETASPAGLTYPADAPRARIDYVLFSGPFEVDSAIVPDTRASDHRPVVVDLRLP